MTRMQQSFKDIKYIIGSPQIVKQMQNIPCMIPFDDRIIVFLNSLSSRILKSRSHYSDLVTFAFWCRTASILCFKQKYNFKEFRLGRGVVFQSTPSNVAINCAFSFAVALLAGNPNIVRLPGKEFVQVELFTKAVKETLKEYPEMIPYIVFVKFPTIRNIIDYFSSMCATRVIWGGDITVSEIRKSPLSPRANEITFADRHSILILDAGAVLMTDQINTLVSRFYNDTFFSDQNACTSPRIIIWVGNNKKRAQERFWDAVHDMVKEKYTLTPIQVVGKLAAFYFVGSKKNLSLVNMNDNYIFRIKVNSLDTDLPEMKYNSGFFFEYDAGCLEEILPVCSGKCQTVTYFGSIKEDIVSLIRKNAPKGIDRVVPVGESMDFSTIWDGYDLIREMSRIVNI